MVIRNTRLYKETLISGVIMKAADIGLITGLASGKIYLPGKNPADPRQLVPVNPEKIALGKDKNGLTYSLK